MTDEPLTCGRNGRSGAVHALQQSTLGIRRRETRFKACGASIQKAEFRGGNWQRALTLEQEDVLALVAHRECARQEAGYNMTSLACNAPSFNARKSRNLIIIVLLN